MKPSQQALAAPHHSGLLASTEGSAIRRVRPCRQGFQKKFKVEIFFWTTRAWASPKRCVSSPTLHRYREAYERAAPSAQALKAEDLITINIDVPSAVTAAVGAMLQIMTFRDGTFSDSAVQAVNR